MWECSVSILTASCTWCTFDQVTIPRGWTSSSRRASSISELFEPASPTDAVIILIVYYCEVSDLLRTHQNLRAFSRDPNSHAIAIGKLFAPIRYGHKSKLYERVTLTSGGSISDVARDLLPTGSIIQRYSHVGTTIAETHSSGVRLYCASKRRSSIGLQEGIGKWKVRNGWHADR